MIVVSSISPRRKKAKTGLPKKIIATNVLSPNLLVQNESTAVTANLTEMADEESRWNDTAGILTVERMTELFTSTLVINVSPGIVIHLNAGPMEIYSADLLKKRTHG